MSRVIGTLLVVLAMWATPFGQAAASDAAAPIDSNPHTPVLLVFGDSLSAGYGVPVGHGWVSLLAQKIAREGYDFTVVNASVTGETSGGGLARLPRTLQRHHPRVVILELGANDGLRGLPLEDIRSNLQRMIELARAAGARVLLIGIRLPPNYGPRYTNGFFALFGELARTDRIALVPWLMAGVALHPQLMQADGLHPDEQGQPLLLDNVWPQLAPLLGRRTGQPHHASGP